MDIVAENCITGRTGDEILTASVEQAKGEGLRPHLYTHPIGVHCDFGLKYLGLCTEVTMDPDGMGV